MSWGDRCTRVSVSTQLGRIRTLLPVKFCCSHPASATTTDMELLQFILVISVFLMLFISVILILIVQMILVILLFLVLVVLAVGLYRPHSEDTGNTKETEDTKDVFLDAERCEECKRIDWECKEWEWEEYGINNEDPDVSPCQGTMPNLSKENEVKFPQLSAGGAFVLLEGSFPPLERRCSSVPFTDPSPKKVPLDTDYLGRAQLNEAAKFKHIDPTCKSEEDAEKKSLKRNSRYPQGIGEYNTVFQVDPKNFILEPNTTHGRVMKSKQPVRNWKCKKVSDSEYEGTEEIPMHAVFLAPEEDCHFSPEESRKTQKSGGSIKLLDLIIDKSKHCC